MREKGTWKRFHHVDEKDISQYKEYTEKTIHALKHGFKDISGQTFSNGNVTAVCLYPEKADGRMQWVAKCNLCGTYFVTTGKNLRTGMAKSCGCLVSKKCSERNQTHGLKKDKLDKRIYQLHVDMIRRCYQKYRPEYIKYGGRGITVCPEWYTKGVQGNPGLVNFHRWMIEQGYTLDCGLTIERIDDNGPYAPWNCRLVDRYKNRSNNTQQNTHIIDRDGERLTFEQFEKKHKLNNGYIANELKTDNTTLDLIVHNTYAKHKAHYDKKSGEYKDDENYIHLIDRINDK